MRTVALPCSNSRTKFKPTPDFIARSTCVRPCTFRRDFNVEDMTLLFIITFVQMQIYEIFIKLHHNGCIILRKIAYHILSAVILAMGILSGLCEDTNNIL